MSNILLVSMIGGLCFATVAGSIYDIFLRKLPLFFAGLIGAAMLLVCPYTAPSLVGLSIVRAVV